MTEGFLTQGKYGKAITLREVQKNPHMSRIRLRFDDGSELEIDKNDRKTLQKYENYGVRSHSQAYVSEIFEIAEIPGDFNEKQEIAQENERILIKRVVDRRWGYDSDGKIIFEMPDGTYKYIYAGKPGGQLKESDMKPIKNAHLLKEKFKKTLTGADLTFLCMAYGLKICEDEK